jgi:putative heme-binding domain-containing protein
MIGRLKLLGCCCLALVTPSTAQQTPSTLPLPNAQNRATPEMHFARLPERNPFETPEDIQLGSGLFQTHCSYCHGARGEGGRGADLTAGDYRNGGSDKDLFLSVRYGIEGSEMGPVRATDEEVWRMVAFVKRLGSAGVREKAPGDAAAGKLVYERKGGCAACHLIDNQGGNLGPELTGIGRRRGLEMLRESLVQPEADLPLQYRGVRIVTKSGEIIVGIRLNEDDFSIQVRDTRDNLRSFLKSNLKEINRDNPSLMPAYGSVLSSKELEDLVAYLNSLRGTR